MTAQLALDLAADVCQAGDCGRPRTHRAVSDWVRGAPGEETRGRAASECCLDHANYYACAWVALALPPWSYPGVRDVAWIEPLEAAS